MTVTTDEKVLAGFRLLRVYVGQQSYALVSEGDLPEGEADEREFGVAWDWTLGDGDKFSIALGVMIEPNNEAPERVEVGVVGEFAYGNATSVTLRDFVKGNGPAILFPYIRQLVTQLTTAGPVGAFYLPPINMLALLNQYSYEETTGARQLVEQNGLQPELTSGQGASS